MLAAENVTRPLRKRRRKSKVAPLKLLKTFESPRPHMDMLLCYRTFRVLTTKNVGFQKILDFLKSSTSVWMKSFKHCLLDDSTWREKS